MANWGEVILEQEPMSYCLLFLLAIVTIYLFVKVTSKFGLCYGVLALGLFLVVATAPVLIREASVSVIFVIVMMVTYGWLRIFNPELLTALRELMGALIGQFLADMEAPMKILMRELIEKADKSSRVGSDHENTE